MANVRYIAVDAPTCPLG